MQSNKNISIPQSGMIRDKHPSTLSESEYSFALNANIEGEDGSVMLRQNEPSNIKCMEFDGYKVIGYKNDVATNNTYFFLAHPINNTSKIVFFESNEFANSIEDIEIGEGVDIERLLGEKLEESSDRYFPACGTYKILVEDDETDPCLNFSIAHPIKTIEIKAEKCGNVIYWTDGYNPPRWISVEKALVPDEDGDFWYRYHGYKICGAAISLDRCKIACEKLRVFPLMDTPCIQAGVMEYGGSLRAGIRQYCVALCDQFGNETTNYHSLTGPVHVFDRNDILVKDGKWGARTNMGVRLDVSNLDKQSMYYKVGVLQKTVGYNGEAQPSHEFFIEGIHPITEQTIYHLSDLDMQPTTLIHLANKRPVYKTSSGITTVGNRLLQYGLTAEPEWNLQPVCNFMGHFIQWQTSVSLDTLYQDGVACAKYAGYMRDEVYPLSISFLTSSDYETSNFVLIPPPKSVEDAEIVENKETESITKYVPNCTGYDRKERWQFYNTAVNLSKQSRSSADECKNEIEIPRYQIVEEDIAVYAPGHRINLTFSPDYLPDNPLLYISNNPYEVCSSRRNPDAEALCSILNGNDSIQPPVFPDECGVPERVRSKDVTTFPLSLIINPSIFFTFKSASEMNKVPVDKIIVEDLSQEQNKIMILFPDRAVIQMKEGNDGPYNGNMQSYFEDAIEQAGTDSVAPMTLGKAIASSRNLRTTPTCTQGCHEGQPIPMPEFSPEAPYLINFSRVIGSSIIVSDIMGANESHSYHLLDELAGDFTHNTFDWHLWYARNIAILINPTFSAAIDPEASSWKYVTYNEYKEDDGSLGDKEKWWPRSNMTGFLSQPYVSANAKWFVLEYPEEWDKEEVEEGQEKVLIFEVYGSPYISTFASNRDTTAYGKFRLSFFTGMSGDPYPNPFESDGSHSKVYDYSSYLSVEIRPDYFKNSKRVLCAVDVPVVSAMWWAAVRREKRKFWGITQGSAILTQSLGIGIRKKEVKYMNLGADSITVRRSAYFQSWCTSCGDTPLNCDPREYEYGNFGYWQSVEKYPSNFELYDSTRVRIKDTSGKKGEIVSRLSEYYGSPVSDENGLYFTGAGSNYPEATPVFCQQPIRHYKFPDNIVAPFCSSVSTVNGTYIYPLGLYINESIVSAFLDIAVDSGLITKEQRSIITGYKIYRGDRTLSKGVIGTGIGFDMYKYEDGNGTPSLYANYPYNDLGEDRFNYKDGGRAEYIHHPYGRSGNVNYSFHSPDYHFNKSESGTEIRIEGYQTGTATGEFTVVEDYPKYVLLGNASISYAKKMARIEATAEAWQDAIAAALQGTSAAFAGTTNNFHPLIAWAYLAMTLTNVGKNYVQLYNRYKQEWLKILTDRGIPENFANYYVSEAYYDAFQPLPSSQSETDTLRGIGLFKNMSNGKYSFMPPSGGSSVVVNNRNRESSVFLSLGEDEYLVNVPSMVRNYDNSRVDNTTSNAQDIISGPIKQRGIQTSYVASPYIKIKRYNPSQYNGIENIRWVSVGYCGKLDDSGEESYVSLFGGDIFISRMSVKRKFPLFAYDAFGLADLLPFCMNDYRNIGFPKFFLDYETKENAEQVNDIKFKDGENSVEMTLTPYRESAYNLDGVYGEWYVKGKFYLYFYGIPQFLVESEINCNERLMGVEPREGFYPAVGDYINWTQEKNVSIKEDEEFMISPIYMARSSLSSRMLPATYERKFWDCAYQRPNGVIWSRVDQSENSMTDPWLYYNPLDVHEFPAKFGKLIHLKGIESEIVLGRFENQVSLFNTVDVLKERMPAEVANELGTGGLFAGRSMDYNKTDLGYSGTQTTEMISSEYGHFWVDAKRGQVFMVGPNGEGLQPIHPGMSHWLQEHLPFKILKYGIINKNTNESMTYDDVDNKFAGIGISLGWDNRFKRVFLTKKDYIPVQEPSWYSWDGYKMYYNGTKVDFTNPEYFIDASFTLAYSCKNNEWISYYSFTPDYYIEHLSYFQTGKNWSNDYREEGLWSHLLTAQSYQVFYGKKYPFMIELPVREQYVNKILSNIQYRMESRRYHSEIDFAMRRSTGFNKAWVYNYRDNSGLLNLIPEEKNNWAQKLKYPKVENGGTSIIATEESEGWSFNDYFNRVKNNENNVPQWIKDINDIEKEVNGDAVYYNSVWKDRLRGDWFLVRYCNDDETRFKMIFRWQSNDEKIYRI